MTTHDDEQTLATGVLISARDTLRAIGPETVVDPALTPTRVDQDAAASLADQSLNADYTGDGLRIAVVDESIDDRHPDLAASYDRTADFDFVDNKPDATLDDNDGHGTAVAGVLIGADDGLGVQGVAFDATHTGLRIISSAGVPGAFSPADTVASALIAAADFDIANNSYGFGQFGDSFTFNAPQLEDALEFGVETGRGGLGTIYVFAAGNGGDVGDDLTGSDLQAARQTIAVGAVDANDQIADFSTPGAAVLVSARGVNVFTADALGSAGFASGDFVTVSGTSFAAPEVAGVTALMLEANPDLGYRDVQQILALSARNPEPSAFQETGATNVNGGGLQFSHSYGFGVVDAVAAIRLAETWSRQSTAANEAMVEAQVDVEGLAIPAGVGQALSLSRAFTVVDDIEIQHVELDVRLRHENVDELSIRLVSPSGTISNVFVTSIVAGVGGAGLTFRLNSVAHLYERSAGQWRIEIVDNNGPANAGDILDIEARFFGAPATDDDTYFYTDDFALYASDPDRLRLVDAGGVDTINAAAVSTDTSLNLTARSLAIAGALIEIDVDTLIENVIAGDGADLLVGGANDNRLEGGRGGDELRGAAGDDVLIGGAGDDVLLGGGGLDTAVFRGLRADFTVEADAEGVVRVGHSAVDGLTPGFIEGYDTLMDVEFLAFDDITIDTTTLIDQAIEDAAPPPPPPDPIAPPPEPEPEPDPDPVEEPPSDPTPVPDPAPEAPEPENFVTGSDIGERLKGSGGDDQIDGAGGGDVLIGFRGRDVLLGGDGKDKLIGDPGGDFLFGEDGRDRVFGEEGDDVLNGGLENDKLIGGVGADVFVFEADFGRDRIVDFDLAVDRLDFTAVADPDAFKYQDIGLGLRIRLDSANHVTLNGVTTDDVDQLMFL